MPGVIDRFPPGTFTAFVLRPPVTGDYNVYNGVPVEVVFGSRNNLKAAWRLWIYASRNRDLIFHGFNTGPFFMLVLRLARVKAAIYSIRGTLHYNGSVQKILRKLAWRAALSGNYYLISNSEYSRDIFLKFLYPLAPDVKVLYNPVGSQRTKSILPDGQRDGLNIIYAGRLAEGKNLFRWIDMAVSIHGKRSDARFYIYGKGPLEGSLTAYSRSCGAETYISFKGFNPNLSEIYSNADLMMFLSEAESFGNAVVESILLGVPVIAADIPSIREIFRDFPEFLVSTGPLMEHEILDKIDRTEELKASALKASEDFSMRFSVEQHVRELRLIYGKKYR